MLSEPSFTRVCSATSCTFCVTVANSIANTAQSACSPCPSGTSTSDGKTCQCLKGFGGNPAVGCTQCAVNRLPCSHVIARRLAPLPRTTACVFRAQLANSLQPGLFDRRSRANLVLRAVSCVECLKTGTIASSDQSTCVSCNANAATSDGITCHCTPGAVGNAASSGGCTLCPVCARLVSSVDHFEAGGQVPVRKCLRPMRCRILLDRWVGLFLFLW